METNYIKRLQNENKALEARIAAILAKATDTEVYYSSAKFQGIDNDYAHVSTDVLPRLRAIKALTLASDDEIATEFVTSAATGKPVRNTVAGILGSWASR